MAQRIIDGAELFAQVCRTYDEFIGLDDLTELMDKMPTVEAIPIEWIKDTIKLAERGVPNEYARYLRMLLKDWRIENGTENN